MKNPQKKSSLLFRISFISLLLFTSFYQNASAARTALEIYSDVEAVVTQIENEHSAALSGGEATRRDGEAASAAAQEAADQAREAQNSGNLEALQRANSILAAANDMLTKSSAVIEVATRRIAAASAAVPAASAAVDAITIAMRDETPANIAAAETALTAARAALATAETAFDAIAAPYNLYLEAKATYERLKGSPVGGSVTSGTESVEFDSPIGKLSPAQLIGKAIKAVLGVIGAIALLMFVYGGLMWMLSGGSADKIKKAQTTLIWATIGLAVIFASYTLVDFVLQQFGA